MFSFCYLDLRARFIFDLFRMPSGIRFLLPVFKREDRPFPIVQKKNALPDDRAKFRKFEQAGFSQIKPDP